MAPVCVDESRLLTAIRALDGLADHGRAHQDEAAHGTHSIAPNHSANTRLQAVLNALAFFIELAMTLTTSACEPQVPRHSVKTAFEARILPCVARFVARKQQSPTTGMDPTRWCMWHNWQCPCGSTRSVSRLSSNHENVGSCAAPVLTTALTTLLFLLISERSLTAIVIQKGLHQFLISNARNGEEKKADTTIYQGSDPNHYHANACPAQYGCDASDALLILDPFDWSMRPVRTLLQQRPRIDYGVDCDVYVVPIGARSLCFLLRGSPIPSNEAEEYELIHRMLVSKSRGATTTIAPTGSHPQRQHLIRQRQRQRRVHRLPSMFTFPTKPTADQIREGTDQKVERCPLCEPKHDPVAWKMARQHDTAQHFAMRALVALALHISSNPADNKRTLRDDIECCFVSWTQFELGSSTEYTVTSEILSTEANAHVVAEIKHRRTHNRVLQTLAWAGLRVLSQDERMQVRAQFTNDWDLYGSNRVSWQCENRSVTRNIAEDGDAEEELSFSSQLHGRLCEVSHSTRHTFAMQEQHTQWEHLHAQRLARQTQLRDALVSVERVRAHILASLGVMCTGREHPSDSFPTKNRQSMLDWLATFPTLESHEQQRVERDEMRHRRILEQQFQLEEKKRRLRDERERMTREDVDVATNTEQARRDEKRDEFRRLRDEMTALTAANSGNDRDDETVRQKRALEEERIRANVLQSKREAAERRQEERERERMTKEDHYYALKLLREKRVRAELEHSDKMKHVEDPLATQKQHIERMRLADVDRKRMDQECGFMRAEDSLARLRRLAEIDAQQMQRQREERTRKEMVIQERELRSLWAKLEDAELKLAEDERKKKRADERPERRRLAAAWTTCEDGAGNVYYYNSISGISQWEPPT